ncbi:2-methylcitrate dehydratase, partial [Bacillus cereus]
MPNKLPDIVKRRLEGESYLKLANELNMSSGQIIEVIDEYRKRVAPLAIKWHEWK